LSEFSNLKKILKDKNNNGDGLTGVAPFGVSGEDFDRNPTSAILIIFAFL
jgi:hypothetical protein